MSTFAQLRAAWDAWSAAAMPTVPMTWSLDPQPMVLKLPVRLEFDGPHTIANTHDRDYRSYTTTSDGVSERLAMHRSAVMTIRAVSRDHFQPAELTLERVRAGLRRSDLLDILRSADCSIRRVGPSVRYETIHDGRQESTAAIEVTIGWRIDDPASIGPEVGTIEAVEYEQAVYRDVGTEPTESTHLIDTRED